MTNESIFVVLIGEQVNNSLVSFHSIIKIKSKGIYSLNSASICITMSVFNINRILLSGFCGK